jgi:hypothetical protein
VDAADEKEDEDESWERLGFAVAPEARGKLDEAMDLAGKILGATSPKWERLEALCQEFLSAHPTDPMSEDDHAAGGAVPVPDDRWLEAAKEALEVEMDRWSFLEAVDPVEAPPLASGWDADPFTLDGELRRLVALRDRWDELVGHLAMLLRMLGLWRDMGFARLSQYCEERLGMCARAVEQRASLERRLYELPALRQAMREGRVSYEKARLVAGCADDESVAEWIARAEATTCIALRREIESRDEAQMRARGEVALRVPQRVATLLGRAFRAARATTKDWLPPGACLERIAQHFIDTWKPALQVRNTPQARALARDRGYCLVPGCSRAAVHAHHVLYRSRGGGDEVENLGSLCAAHHLRGVHAGFIRVTGRAPDGLVWELRLRPRGPDLPSVLETRSTSKAYGLPWRTGPQ